jgi:hypothetical protein
MVVADANLPAGIRAPALGVYVVRHTNSYNKPWAAHKFEPVPGVYIVRHMSVSQAPPNEVLIAVPAILPKCNACADVRFSFKAPLPEFPRTE